MPRVDEGFYIVDISDVLRLDMNILESFIKWALLARPLLLVEPAIALLSTPNSSRALYLSLGVGSLISSVEPPYSIRFYITRRPFWANGWKVGVREPSFRILEGERVRVEGVIRALDAKDPVALIVNGVKGVNIVCTNVRSTGASLAVLEGITVLYRVNGGYETILVEGEGAKRVKYMATLVSSASRESVVEDFH